MNKSKIFMYVSVIHFTTKRLDPQPIATVSVLCEHTQLCVSCDISNIEKNHMRPTPKCRPKSHVSSKHHLFRHTDNLNLFYLLIWHL